MRVYKAKRDIVFDNPLFRTIRAGEVVYQEDYSETTKSIPGYRLSYLQKRGYPLPAKLVEDAPGNFERLGDSDKSPEYFLTPIYTQEEMDIALIEARDAGANSVYHSNY